MSLEVLAIIAHLTVAVLLLAAIGLTLKLGDTLRREQKDTGVANGWERRR